MNIERNILDLVGVTWKSEIKRLPLAKTDKTWNRERMIKSYIRFLNTYAPELLKEKGKIILDVSTGAGILLEVLRALDHGVIGTEKPDTLYRGMHRAANLWIQYHDSTSRDAEKKIKFPFDEREFHYVFCLDAMNFYPIQVWREIIQEFMRMATQTVIVGFIYDGYFQANGWEIRDWSFEGYKLTLNHTTVFRWDKN